MKYHEHATGADKLVYNRIIEQLDAGVSVAAIARELTITRKTVYAVRDRRNQTQNEAI